MAGIPPRRPVKKTSAGVFVTLSVLFLAAVVGGGFYLHTLSTPDSDSEGINPRATTRTAPLAGNGTHNDESTNHPYDSITETSVIPSGEHAWPTWPAGTTGHVKPITTARVPQIAVEPPEPEEPVVQPAEAGESIASAVEEGQWSHRFFFHPEGNDHIDSVAVAGDFNNWSKDATPLTKEAEIYEATVPLPEGEHAYKFVLNGNRWITDPSADHAMDVPDTFGGYNSSVLVGPDGRNLPPPDRQHILISAVRHNPQDQRDCDVVSSSLVELSIRTQADNLTDAAVWIRQGRTGTWERYVLSRTGHRLGFDRFTTLVSVDGPYIKYIFELVDGVTKRYVASGKAYTLAESARTIPYKAYLRPTFETPEWAKHVVWYQIFPERFRNGDPSNDPPGTVKWTSKWFSTLPGEKGKFYQDVWSRRYGGDFQGILWSLPYLRKLGVNAIYLNPIFKANDLHKYDTTDYRHVDDTFGYKGDYDALKGETEDPATWQWTKTDKLFLQFLAEAHREGFKVIIDGVFNHVGKANWAFQDVVKNGRASKYADWFEVTSWEPFHYNAWDGNDGALPRFKKDEITGLVHGPYEHIMAITQRWLAPDGDPSKGIDGFRLDVPNEVPHAFWIDWRKVVKEAHPGAYISGEIWTPAQAWLQGDQFDATMNYPFAKECQSFFVNVKRAERPSDFAGHMQELVDQYPFQVSLVMQNLVDSHDTDRFASQFVNPDLDFKAATRIQDNGPNYSPAKPTPLQYTRMRQAVAFQMTFAGAPMIWYGDEAGMWGPDDPSNRQPMTWQDLEPYDDPEVKFNGPQFEFYQRAIAVRRQVPTLQVGMYHTIKADNTNSTLVFARSLDGQNVYVVLNRSNHEQRIEFKAYASDKDIFLMDWMDADNFALKEASANVPDGRPMLIRRIDGKGKRATNGVLTVELPAYSTAIMARPPAPAN